MIKGGYQMIDCKNLNLLEDQEAQKVDGLYEKCQEALKSNKFVLAENCIWGTGKPITPIPVFLIQLQNDTITATSSTLQLAISAQDYVTILNLVQS